MAEKTVIDALEMCAVEGQHEAALSIASLAIKVIIGDVLDGSIIAGQVQKAAMGAVVHLLMIQDVTGVFLN